ncbi:MAG: PaaX family transcriptional regulator [Alphaproteobacteria bacterium]|nr:PaaX family transcriptional regulator [Alphaproteobacteria bacterium]
MTNEALQALRRHGDLGVWSVLVSLFGDLVCTRDTRISGANLMRVTGLMGIKPQAVRVALHRLRKDGWIVSEKTGRTSEYGLSGSAYAESLTAGRRIYARETVRETGCFMLIGEANGASVDGMRVATGVYIAARAPCPSPPGFLVIPGEPVELPDWVKAALGPAKLAQDYQALRQVLTFVAEELAREGAIDAAESAALRVLIVHHWRRILLRHEDLAAQFFPAGWCGEECRILVVKLLERLEKPAFAT